MKAAVFDFDGTIVDSMGFWNNLAKNYLSSIGIKARDGLDKALEKLTLDEGASYMKEEYKIEKTKVEIQDEMDGLLFEYYRDKVELKPYVLELLDKLKRENIKMAIASVTDERLIASVLNRYGIRCYFEFIQTCENTGLSKSDSRFFDLLSERLNLNSSDIYIFEDTLYPIVVAKEAGFRTIGVEDDLATKHRKKIKELVDCYIKDFSEISLQTFD